MNERPELARLATSLLAMEPIDDQLAPPSPEEEARAIEAIARAIDEGRRRKRRRQVAGVIAGALALAAGFMGVRLFAHGSQGVVATTTPSPAMSVAGFAVDGEVRVVHDGHEAPLGDGVKLAAKDRLVAKAGRASLAFSTGTHVMVEQGSDVTIAEEDLVQRFELKSGAVRADVAKLRAGERFIVHTEDTEVEVRGTSFRVAVVPKHTCGVPSATEVSVSEGRVWVRFAGQETVLSAGESWPPACTTQLDAPAVAPHQAPPTATVRLLAPPQQGFGKSASRPAPTALDLGPSVTSAPPQATNNRPATVDAPPPPPLPASELAEQNRVFEEALGAKRRGDAPGAIAGFERFAAKYPKSALVESAMAERMRLLASTDEERAQDAAKQYLERWPDGFAASEAKAIRARAR